MACAALVWVHMSDGQIDQRLQGRRALQHRPGQKQHFSLLTLLPDCLPLVQRLPLLRWYPKALLPSRARLVLRLMSIGLDYLVEALAGAAHHHKAQRRASVVQVVQIEVELTVAVQADPGEEVEDEEAVDQTTWLRKTTFCHLLWKRATSKRTEEVIRASQD